LDYPESKPRELEEAGRLAGTARQYSRSSTRRRCVQRRRTRYQIVRPSQQRDSLPGTRRDFDMRILTARPLLES
jgi:hypothetical protein